MATIPEKKRADFTEGSIIQSILKMGVPSMIGFLASHIYYMIDMYWVSHLPERETAVAAVTIYSNIAWVFFSFNSLIGTGSVAIISRRYGEKNYDATETAIKETFLLKWLSGMALGLVGYFFIDELVYIGGARDETLRLGIEYGRVIFLGMGFTYVTYSVYTAMRGIANPNLAMGIMLGSTVMNLILDPLFIFGYLGFPKLGVMGAAVASVTSYTLTFLIGWGILYTGVTNVSLHLKSRIPMSFKTMIQIVKIGVPSWIGEMSYSGARFILMPMIAIFGNSVVAAYGVGMQISAIGISILVGIGLGLAALIGHNLGGEKKERARKTANQAVLLGIGIMTAAGLLVYFFGGAIMSLYFDLTETVEHGATLLRVFAFGFPFIGALIMIEQIYAGVGLNVPAMITNAGNAWLLQIPAIYILTQIFNLNQESVWWAINVSSMIAVSGLYMYFRRGQWRYVKV
ncbi:MAG: MATE family efflux transporter [Candidatus Zixiibacteriota bacterium]